MNELKNSQCLFLITQPRSGSTLLMRLINTIEGYNICGENKGALVELSKFYQSLLFTANMGLDLKNNTKKYYDHFETDNCFLTYNELLNRPKVKKEFSGFEWYNKFNLESIQEKLRELIIEMFNPEKKSIVWGFKEIRYGKESYKEFENELLILKELFPLAKFIFNTRKLEDAIQSAWLAQNPDESRQMLNTQSENFLKYHQKYPEFTYHITYQDVVNNTETLHRLYDFLGEKFNRENYQAVLDRR